MSIVSQSVGVSTSQSPAVGTAAIDGRVILMVDDDESVRAVTTLLLRRRGIAVDEAVDGVEGMHLFVLNPLRYALLMVDLSMPRMNGRDFLVAVRSLRPTQPVLAVSGHDWREAHRLLDGQHVDGYLQKPFTSDQLFAAIDLIVKTSADG